uniref:Uncharacterized protein n=2 Tax=Clytia hemisphaerica TaxID=252671 RepID=A0A7M5X5K4_9CNID
MESTEEAANHQMKEQKSSTSRRGGYARAIKRWTLDRFVLAHFFVVFLVSFVIGILFMHSTFIFGEQVEEVELEQVLNDLGVDQTANYVQMDTVEYKQTLPVNCSSGINTSL